MKNEIMEELWAVKEQMAREYDYDIDAMGKAYLEKQQARKQQKLNLREQRKGYDEKP